MVTEILFLLFLIMLNAFFAASEMALISLNDNRVNIMAEDGNKKAKLLKNLLNEPSKFLATIQIGITLAGFLASAFAAESFAGRLVLLLKNVNINLPEIWLKNFSLILITLILSYITLVLGELVPKRIAMKKSEPISMFVVKPLNVLSIITSPFVKLLTISTNFFVRLFGINPNEEDDNVTEEEIRMMVDVGEEKGTIHESEKFMINNIFEFNDKTVKDIMTHRTEIFALPIEANLKEVVSFINIEKYSRIPIYEDNIDNIIGILYSKSLIHILVEENHEENFILKDIIKKPYFVPASKRINELFKELQKNKIHIAVVIDEYGGTAGIITLEDLLEEIVGNIFDEYDEDEKDILKLDDHTFIINGATSLDAIEDYFDVKLPIEKYDTLNGFLIGQLGKIPKKDDNAIVEYNDLVFKVEDVDEKRITKVKLGK